MYPSRPNRLRSKGCKRWLYPCIDPNSILGTTSLPVPPSRGTSTRSTRKTGCRHGFIPQTLGDDGDPFTNEIRDIKDIRSHALLELGHFFQVYKDHEHVRVETRGFDNATAAKQVIFAAAANYTRKLSGRKRASRAPRTR